MSLEDYNSAKRSRAGQELRKEVDAMISAKAAPLKTRIAELETDLGAAQADIRSLRDEIDALKAKAP